MSKKNPHSPKHGSGMLCYAAELSEQSIWFAEESASNKKQAIIQQYSVCLSNKHCIE